MILVRIWLTWFQRKLKQLQSVMTWLTTRNRGMVHEGKEHIVTPRPILTLFLKGISTHEVNPSFTPWYYDIVYKIISWHDIYILHNNKGCSVILLVIFSSSNQYKIWWFKNMIIMIFASTNIATGGSNMFYCLNRTYLIADLFN